MPLLSYLKKDTVWRSGYLGHPNGKEDKGIVTVVFTHDNVLIYVLYNQEGRLMQIELQ